MQKLSFAKKAIKSIVNTIEDRANTRDRNLLCLEISETLIYLEYLEIILHRYNKASNLYFKNYAILDEIMQKSEENSRELTDYEMKLSNKNIDLGKAIRFEIESFYLFSHILLNKLVVFPCRYFRHEFSRVITYGSHNQFWKSIVKINNFDPIKQELLELANWLNEKIVNFRDKQITHTLTSDHFQRRLIRGMSWSPDQKIRIQSLTLYPDKKTSNAEQSEDVEILSKKIEDYIKEFCIFLDININKSILIKDPK